MMRLPSVALASLAATVVALGMAGAGAGANEFAVGSAKTDLAVVGFGTALEHASFSAHSTGVGCEATGHMVYKGQFGNLLIELQGDVEQLIIDGQRALLLVRITKQRGGEPFNFVGQIAGFDAFDSGLAGGTGDEFFFDFIGSPGCTQVPIAGHPITQGNIVIKSTGPMLLP